MGPTTIFDTMLQIGDMKKARQISAHVIRAEPDFKSEVFGRKLPIKDPAGKQALVNQGDVRKWNR